MVSCCYIFCETIKDTKGEYYFHSVSKIEISIQLYFKDTYDVISLTMATRQVHKKVLELYFSY